MQGGAFWITGSLAYWVPGPSDSSPVLRRPSIAAPLIASGWRCLPRLGGVGGCDSIDYRETRHYDLHPGLTFVEGTCVREHGDTARGIVAVDSAGQVYLLNNPSGLEFMLRVHPAKPLGRAQALDYVASALAMMGAINLGDTVVPFSAAIPDSVLMRAGVTRSELMDSSRVLRELSRGYEVAVTTWGPGGLTASIAIVHSDSGFVRVTSRRNWPLHGE